MKAGLSSDLSHDKIAFESFAPDISEQPDPNLTDPFDTRNHRGQRLSASYQHSRDVVATRTHAHTTRDKGTKAVTVTRRPPNGQANIAAAASSRSVGWSSFTLHAAERNSLVRTSNTSKNVPTVCFQYSSICKAFFCLTGEKTASLHRFLWELKVAKKVKVCKLFSQLSSCTLFVGARSCEKSLETFTFDNNRAICSKSLQTFCVANVAEESCTAEKIPVRGSAKS